MSRIGNKVIVIPSDVKVSLLSNVLKAEGPKGVQEITVPSYLKVEINNNELVIKKLDDERLTNKMHGSFRALSYNLIMGVHELFSKTLEIQGVGYRASLDGNKLVMQMGFSHNVVMELPKGITCTVDKNTTIVISGADKQVVGEFAANVRKIRKPEPYKGKGIRYLGEHVRRKAGKTAK